MKRIALQYSGQMRHILDVWNNHYENFVLRNKDYEVDIFAHLWQYPGEEEKKQKFLQWVNPTHAFFEEQKDFTNSNIECGPNICHPIERVLSMFYSMEQANKIRIRHETTHNKKYDYVIRLRTDSIFTVPMEPVDFYEKEFVHTFWGPIHADFAEYCLNDHFAIGSPKYMNDFLNVYSNLDQMVLMGTIVNPECFLGFNAKYIYKIPIKFHQQWRFLKYDTLIDGYR